MRSLIAWIAFVAASAGAAGYNPRRRLADSSDCTCDNRRRGGQGRRGGDRALGNWALLWVRPPPRPDPPRPWRGVYITPYIS